MSGAARSGATVEEVLARLALGPELSSRLDSSVWRQLGERVEASVEAVGELLGEEAADAVWAYRRRCERFWDDLEAGRGGGCGYVRVRRVLRSAAQRTGRDRSDLVAELGALEGLGGFAEVLEVAAGPSPDIDALVELASVCGVEVRVEDSVVVLAGRFASGVVSDPLLGGPPSRGEVERIVEVWVRHATWRDRRVRRLARVEVRCDEVWPAPSGTSWSIGEHR